MERGNSSESWTRFRSILRRMRASDPSARKSPASSIYTPPRPNQNPDQMPTAAAEPRTRTKRGMALVDQDLKEYRDLLPPPDHWEYGFDLKAMMGALFVGLIMTPASMYMSLVVGADIGSAAQW